METPCAPAFVRLSVVWCVSAALPFAGFSWHLMQLPLRIVVDVQEFCENQHREGHTFVKRAPVIMPCVVQFLSDLLNIHYRRCLETSLRQRQLWESRQQ